MPNLLVVEDQESMLSLLQESFENDGYQVFAATNVDDALQILKTEHVDVLMTDLNLPERSGIELVVKSAEDYENIFIIVVTGGDTVGNEFLDESMLLGAHKTFKKPFDIKEVKKAIRDGLSETRVANDI